MIGPTFTPWRVSAIPMRLRTFVAHDASLLAVLLTEVQSLELLTLRASLTSPPGTGIGVEAAPIAQLTRLYRNAVASDERVLRTAERFEAADRQVTRSPANLRAGSGYSPLLGIVPS